jgi:hypothetical protein
MSYIAYTGGTIMTKKTITVITLCAAAILLLCIVMGANFLLTRLIESTSVVCRGQKFSSAEEAIQAMEASEREANDTSLDYCPPYELVYSFDYENKTIVFYSYCYSYDGEQSTSYAVRILKKNGDGTLSFDNGFAVFRLMEPTGNEKYYYFTNMEASKGNRSISFLYLPKDSDKDIFVDGIQAERVLVSIQGNEFYICYAISNQDTFLSNLFTAISNRHKIDIK